MIVCFQYNFSDGHIEFIPSSEIYNWIFFCGKEYGCPVAAWRVKILNNK